jgi:hypothetical protein
VIQSNFPAPAWLDLKTFAPQPFKQPQEFRRKASLGLDLTRSLCPME